MPPSLAKVIRLDNLPLNQTYFTSEGYLVDRPILTTTGIFEYHNADGSVRRELRLPDEVFSAESLKSYKGHPIIITHDAGEVDKNNVTSHQIGTILTEGYRSGDDVRAEIIIHDTDKMKAAGLKELSLGYHVDLDETPGEWNGQRYDAIQRNIRINHLALVRNARAGEQARLNIDSRDPVRKLQGGKAMANPKQTETKPTQHADGLLTSEQLAQAISEYKARRSQQPVQDEDPVPAEETVVETAEETVVDENAVSDVEQNVLTTDEKISAIKERQVARAGGEGPSDLDAAKSVILQQDEDLATLVGIIDQMKAAEDYKNAKNDAEDDQKDEEVLPEDDVKNDEQEPATPEETETHEDQTDVEDPDDQDDKKDGAGCNEDSAESEPTTEPAAEDDKTTLNEDSIDAIVTQRVTLGIMGRQLNLDGLEHMPVLDAKKAIISAVRPGMRLDGKSEDYIAAAFDLAAAEIEAQSEKDTAYQKRQMFNKDSGAAEEAGTSAADARQRMIDRQTNKI